MLIGTLRLKLSLSWAQSLKDKRMMVKSLCAKLRDKFLVSVAEVDELDVIKTAVIGVACVGNSTAHLDSVLDHIIVW
ncbi:MAG: DUF503 domain-containing protein, partial [Oscillospiraceae bacterium]|nr:DUF503 domain-containing protein [Oscillospiraceae bacterium]